MPEQILSPDLPSPKGFSQVLGLRTIVLAAESMRPPDPSLQVCSSSNDRFRGRLRVLSHLSAPRSLEDAAFFPGCLPNRSGQVVPTLKKEELTNIREVPGTEIVWNPEVKPLNHLLCSWDESDREP